VFNIRGTTNGAACVPANGRRPSGMGAGGDRALSQWGYEGISPENFGNFICQTVHFGKYLCDNWSTEWAHFPVLNTDVEAFLNQLSY